MKKSQLTEKQRNTVMYFLSETPFNLTEISKGYAFLKRNDKTYRVKVHRNGEWELIL